MTEKHRCRQCGAEFPTAQALQEHMTEGHIHGREQPRERQENCPACNMEFPSAESLRHHQETAHGERVR